MSWEPIDPKKPRDNELIGDEAFDVLADAVLWLIPAPPLLAAGGDAARIRTCVVAGV